MAEGLCLCVCMCMCVCHFKCVVCVGARHCKFVACAFVCMFVCDCVSHKFVACVSVRAGDRFD